MTLSDTATKFRDERRTEMFFRVSGRPDAIFHLVFSRYPWPTIFYVFNTVIRSFNDLDAQTEVETCAAPDGLGYYGYTDG